MCQKGECTNDGRSTKQFVIHDISNMADIGDNDVTKEVVSNNLTSFASLVRDGGGSRTVIRSLYKGKPTHVKVDVQIPLSSVLEAHSRAARELRYEMIIAIPNVDDDDDGEVLHIVRVE
nr:hypothetical protein [Tanacetum cinerariifolium]